MNATFTASQIAAAAGVTSSAIRWQLRDVSPDATVMVSGQEAAAWSLARLPDSIQQKLSAAATRGGCRSTEQMLADPPNWNPEIPVEECAEPYQKKARMLQRALATALEKRNDPMLSARELQEIGLRDYKAAFGSPISASRWHFLFYRTIERAGASENFSRLDLYLDRRAARKEQAMMPEAKRGKFFKVELALSQCGDLNNLSKDERRHVLVAMIETYAALVDLGEPAKRVKRDLLKLVAASGARLSKSRNSLRQYFQWHYDRWLTGGSKEGSLQDRRSEANRKRARPIPEEDRELVIMHAVMACGGRISQAWRECVQKGMLSEELMGRFLHNPASKSHVPFSIREAMRCEVDMVEENHHGPRGTRDNGAYIERYWGSTPSYAWYCMDDCTLPILFWVPDGKGWFTLMRGQFLLAIDTRSTCILGYALMPERNYNARAIRTLITHIADEYGLPTRGFYFERGIWKDAKILTGAKGDAPLDWIEVERGLTEFGLVFKHTIRARSKPIERVLGALQNLLEGDPGYVGRNEIIDGFEQVKRLQLQVASRKLDPRETFYSHEQWDKRLEAICQQYNAETQQGKMTMGLSPEDALHGFKDKSDKSVHFGASCRYLLALHKRPILVTKNGITLHFGKQVFNYRNKRTGELRGQTVIAWFNPELPEVLAVTDMKKENAFCVERSQSVPALDAPEELLAQETQRVADHMSYARTRYRVLKAKYDQDFRPLVVDRHTVELGQQIEGGRAEATARIKQKRDLQTRARKVYGGLGLDIPNAGDARPEQIEAAQRLANLLNEGETL